MSCTTKYCPARSSALVVNCGWMSLPRLNRKSKSKKTRSGGYYPRESHHCRGRSRKLLAEESDQGGRCCLRHLQPNTHSLGPLPFPPKHSCIPGPPREPHPVGYLCPSIPFLKADRLSGLGLRSVTSRPLPAHCPGS